jgi:hypothetical protein
VGGGREPGGGNRTKNVEGERRMKGEKTLPGIARIIPMSSLSVGGETTSIV